MLTKGGSSVEEMGVDFWGRKVSWTRWHFSASSAHPRNSGVLAQDREESLKSREPA